MKSVLGEQTALEADFRTYECPSWEEDATYRDAAIRWHQRGFEAGLEFARKTGWNNHD